MIPHCSHPRYTGHYEHICRATHHTLGHTLNWSQVEANFLDYVVTPLWERLVEVLPELAPCLTTLTANRQLYGELASRGSFASPSMARAPRSSSSVAVVLPREGAQTGSAPSSLTAAPLNGAPVDGVAPRPSDGA